jgi:D-alanine-D-alanine ligase-like ATP-grasp enzyme
MSRIDIRMNDKGDIFILDINTLPNLDPDRSLLPKICIHQGVNYSTLLDRVMKMALKLKSKEV